LQSESFRFKTFRHLKTPNHTSNQSQYRYSEPFILDRKSGVRLYNGDCHSAELSFRRTAYVPWQPAAGSKTSLVNFYIQQMKCQQMYDKIHETRSPTYRGRCELGIELRLVSVSYCDTVHKMRISTCYLRFVFVTSVSAVHCTHLLVSET